MSDEDLPATEQPAWQRPNMTTVVIAEVTLALGKLGSMVDLGGENNFSAE